jgi:hypothetical protein
VGGTVDIWEKSRKAQGPQTGYGTKKTEASPCKKKRQQHQILWPVLKRKSVD